MSREPLATHKLDNGWTVREYHALRESVSVEIAANHDGNLGRFVVRYVRRHQQKLLTIYHLIGSTPEERQRSLKSALNWAAKPHRFPMQPYWYRHRDPHFKGNYYYSIKLGDSVNEVDAFEELRRGLPTDDAVDLEFKSIVHRIGVSA